MGSRVSILSHPKLPRQGAQVRSFLPLPSHFHVPSFPFVILPPSCLSLFLPSSLPPFLPLSIHHSTTISPPSPIYHRLQPQQVFIYTHHIGIPAHQHFQDITHPQLITASDPASIGLSFFSFYLLPCVRLLRLALPSPPLFSSFL